MNRFACQRPVCTSGKPGAYPIRLPYTGEQILVCEDCASLPAAQTMLDETVVTIELPVCSYCKKVCTKCLCGRPRR